MLFHNLKHLTQNWSFLDKIWSFLSHSKYFRYPRVWTSGSGLVGFDYSTKVRVWVCRVSISKFGFLGSRVGTSHHGSHIGLSRLVLPHFWRLHQLHLFVSHHGSNENESTGLSRLDLPHFRRTWYLSCPLNFVLAIDHKNVRPFYVKSLIKHGQNWKWVQAKIILRLAPNFRYQKSHESVAKGPWNESQKSDIFTSSENFVYTK